jgi:uncharacterized RDD family membrane protein YckC
MADQRTPEPPASLRRRLAAFAVDYVLIALYLIVLTLVAVAIPSTTRVFRTPATAQAVGVLFLTLPVMLYFSLGEASRHEATPGKRAVGIVVVRASGKPMTLSRGLLRNALKFVPWELAHTCIWRIPGWPNPTGPLPTWIVAGFIAVWLLVVVNLVMAWKSPTGQTAYDRVADSVVLRTVRPPRGTATQLA